MHRGVITGTFVVIAALIAVGVITLLDTEPGQSPTEQSQPLATENESTDQMVELDMSEHRFSVETIEAAPGEIVTIELTNLQGIHNFVIDELDVDSGQLAAGQSRSVTFVIPENTAGQTYDFYCNVGNHRSLGMEGQLVVSDE